jgi:hypothetical protein
MPSSFSSSLPAPGDPYSTLNLWDPGFRSHPWVRASSSCLSVTSTWLGAFNALIRLLKNSSGHHLRWLACLKGPCFLYNSIDHQTACPNPSPKPFCQLEKTVNLWPGQIPGEGQVQLHQGYKKKTLPAILCSRVCSAGVSTGLHPFDQKKLPCQDFSLSLMSVFGTRGSLIPALAPPALTP